MEFLGKDKLARLDEERQRRRLQRAEEAKRRLDEVGKQTQQMLAEQLRPEGRDGEDQNRKVGGLSRVLFETATGKSDPREKRRVKRLFNKTPLHAQAQQALGSIDQAVKMIHGAVNDTTLAGFRDGLSGAAAQVTDAVQRVTTMAQGKYGAAFKSLTQDPLADLMKAEREDAAAAEADRDAAEDREDNARGSLGELRDTLQEHVGGFANAPREAMGEMRMRAGAIVDAPRAAMNEMRERAGAIENAPRETLGEMRERAGAIVETPRETLDNALAVPREVGQRLGNLPESARRLADAPTEAAQQLISAPREAIERAADAPREIAQNLQGAPKHAVDNVRALGEHVARDHRHGFAGLAGLGAAADAMRGADPRAAIEEAARGLDPRNAIEQTKQSALGTLTSTVDQAKAALDPQRIVEQVKQAADPRNALANVQREAESFDPRRIADQAAALDPHNLGAQLGAHLDPRQIAERTAAEFDPRRLVQGTAAGIVVTSFHEALTKGEAAQFGKSDARQETDGAAPAQNAAAPATAATPAAPTASAHPAQQPHAPAHVPAKPQTPAAKEAAHHHHPAKHEQHAHHAPAPVHGQAHHPVAHAPAPHSAAAPHAHANPHGHAPPAHGAAPATHTPVYSRTANVERAAAVHPTHIAPSASRAVVDVASRAPMNVQLQPVQSAEPKVDRNTTITQPSFQISAKGESPALPNLEPAAAQAPQSQVAPPSQAAPAATQARPTTSGRQVRPLANAPGTPGAPTNPALAAARGATAGLQVPQGTTQPLPASAAPAAGAAPTAAPTNVAGAGAVNAQAQSVAAPPAAQLPATPASSGSPAAPQTQTSAPAAPNIPQVSNPGGDSPPDPGSLVQQTVSLSGDRSAASSAISAEAQTQSRVAPEAQAQKASEVAPLGPEMSTTARSADAPISAANSSATSQGQSETAAGRSGEQAESAQETGAIAGEMAGASAQRAQYAGMPPPPILQQTAPGMMQPLASAAGSAVHAAAAAVSATPVHVSPGAIARGAAAAATPSQLPPFDAGRFAQIDHRAPLPPLETGIVDEAHTAAGQTYQAAGQQVQQLSNIQAPQIQAPAGPVNAKTQGGYPTREAAIAQIEGQITEQGRSQAPAQTKAAAAPVQNQLNTHVSTQQAQALAQSNAQVQQAQSQAQAVAQQPPPITGAQAAANAQPQYESHQNEATAAHNQMRTQIAGAQSHAEGQVQVARGQRDAQIATAQGQYSSTVQGQVMPQYAAQQNAAHSQFSASNQAAQAQMASEQTQAQAQATAQNEQAKAKADSDISTHQSTLAAQQQQAVASHQQQVQAADAQHQAQMQQAQSQMDSQVAQHQSQMQSQVASKQSEGQQQVNDHLTQGEQAYQQHIADGTAQANAKKAQAEQEAAAKKAQADAEKKKGGGGGIFGSICSFVSGLVNDLLDAVKSILKAACDAVVSIMQAARNAAVAALNAARQAALAALDAVKSAIQGIITAAANAIKAVISAAASLIKGLIQELASVLKSLVSALTTMLTTLVQAFKMAVDGILQGLSAALSLVDKVLGTHLHDAVDHFRQKFDTAMNKLSSDIQAAGKALEAGIQKAADAACAVVDAAAHKLEQAVTAVENTLNAAVEAAYQLGAAAINKAFDLAEAAVNTAFDVAEAAVKTYFEAQIAMIGLAQKAVTAVSDFVVEVANKALEVVDKIAQAVVAMIPDSWTKAFVDFWNGPWRTVIIIGLATVAAVAITAATLGTGAPIAAMLMAGVIGGTLAGGTYFAGEMVAREGDIKLSDEGKGMYVPGFGYAQMGPDGQLIPPPGMSKDKLAQFQQQSQWASSNFNLEKDASGQVVGYDRKSGSEIGNYAVAEGIKGFGEGFVSSALAVAGGGAGSWVADSLNMAGGTVLRSAVESTVANVITGPIQSSLTSAWDAGFEAIKDGKSPMDALKAAWGGASAQLSNPGNWASAMLMMGIAPAKLKFVTPALEGSMENVESRLVKTVVSKGTDVAFDTMGQTFGQAGGNFIGAYYQAIKDGKSPGEALDAARKAADESFSPESIAQTLLMNTAGAISGPAHGGHQPIEGEYGTTELGRGKPQGEPPPDRTPEHMDLIQREQAARDNGGGAVDFPEPHTMAERESQAATVERDANVQLDKVKEPPQRSFIDRLLGRETKTPAVEAGPKFDAASRDFSAFYQDQSREAHNSLEVNGYHVDQMVDEYGIPMTHADGSPYGYGGESAYSVNRYESNGEHLTEITMKVHLDAGEGVTPADIERIKQSAADGIDTYYNSGHRLPNGDHLNVKVEFVDDPAQAHLNVDLHAGSGDADHLNWFVNDSSAVQAHELGHQLGFNDEYFDPKARFRSSADSTAIAHDGSLMGSCFEIVNGSERVKDGTGIRERHLQQLNDDIQRSRAARDLMQWETLNEQRGAIAEGHDPYSQIPLEDRQRALSVIDDRLTDLRSSYEEAQRAVENAATPETSPAERARQAGNGQQDFAELLSEQAKVKEREDAATVEVRKEMRQLAEARNEVEEGNGPWQYATDEQRKQQLAMIDDQLQQANDRRDQIVADLAQNEAEHAATVELAQNQEHPEGNQAPGAPRPAEDRLPPLPPEADRQVRGNIRQIEEIQRQIQNGEGQYRGMTPEQRQQQMAHWDNELERQVRWANDNAVTRQATAPARWDGQTPQVGEVWSFQSKSGNFYRGEFRGFDPEGHVMLDMGDGKGPVPLDSNRLVSARSGMSAPELHQFGPNDPVTLYSVRGNPHTGVIEGYDRAGNVLLRTDHGVETLRTDQLDLNRTHPAGPAMPEQAGGGLVHFGADAQKHIELATKLGLMPDHPIEVGNAKYKMGQPFDIGQGRMGVLIEVEVDGKRYMRVAYTSNSQGGFRLLPARNERVPYVPGYDKGIGEHAIMLPNAVDEALMKRVSAGDVRHDIPPDQASQVFEGGVVVNRSMADYANYMQSPDHVKNSVQTVNILGESRDVLPTAGGHDLPAPGQVHIADPAQRPDFSKPVRVYRTETSLAGPVDALVYRSHDGSLEYVMYRDSENHVWFKSVSVTDPTITPQGVSKIAVDAGALTTPYWEYKQQIPGELIGESNPRPGQDHYASSWAYLKEMPEIRSWYEANGMQIPGEHGPDATRPLPRQPRPPADDLASRPPGFENVREPHPDAQKYRLEGPSNFHFNSSDSGRWPEQLKTFASDQFHVDPARLQVKQFGAGKSGDLVFGMWMDGKNLGVLKVYRDPGGAGVDAHILHVVNDAGMEHYQPAEDKGRIGQVTIDGSPASSLFTELVPGRSVEDLIDHVPPPGAARDQYMAMLDKTMAASARSYAELHDKLASGEPMSKQRRVNESRMILSKLDTVFAKNGDRHFASPELMAEVRHRLRDVIGPKFIETDLPATAFHGDAHVGNIQVDEHMNARPIDLTSMKWSLDEHGKGTGTGAVDVGQYVARLYEKSEGKLSIEEINRLKQTFTQEYFKNSAVPEDKMRAATQLYAVESQLARIQFDIGNPKDAMRAITEILGIRQGDRPAQPRPPAEEAPRVTDTSSMFRPDGSIDPALAQHLQLGEAARALHEAGGHEPELAELTAAARQVDELSKTRSPELAAAKRRLATAEQNVARVYDQVVTDQIRGGTYVDPKTMQASHADVARALGTTPEQLKGYDPQMVDTLRDALTARTQASRWLAMFDARADLSKPNAWIDENRAKYRAEMFDAQGRVDSATRALGGGNRVSDAELGGMMTQRWSDGASIGGLKGTEVYSRATRAAERAKSANADLLAMRDQLATASSTTKEALRPRVQAAADRAKAANEELDNSLRQLRYAAERQQTQSDVAAARQNGELTDASMARSATRAEESGAHASGAMHMLAQKVVRLESGTFAEGQGMNGTYGYRSKGEITGGYARTKMIERIAMLGDAEDLRFANPALSHETAARSNWLTDLHDQGMDIRIVEATPDSKLTRDMKGMMNNGGWIRPDTYTVSVDPDLQHISIRDAMLDPDGGPVDPVTIGGKVETPVLYGEGDKEAFLGFVHDVLAARTARDAARSGPTNGDAALSLHEPTQAQPKPPVEEGPRSQPEGAHAATPGPERSPEPISIGGDQASELFHTISNDWRDGVDVKKLNKLFEKVAKKGPESLSAKEQAKLKEMRKLGAKLRSGYLVLAAEHASPKVLDKFVSEFGKLNDAIEAGASDKAQAYAKSMRARVEKNQVKKIDKGIVSFEPTSHSTFDQVIDERFQRVDSGLEQSALPVHDFHQLRKDMKDLMNLFDLLKGENGDPRIAEAHEQLKTLNDQLGEMHDDVVHAGMRGELDYKKATVDPPPEFHAAAAEARALFGREPGSPQEDGAAPRGPTVHEPASVDVPEEQSRRVTVDELQNLLRRSTGQELVDKAMRPDITGPLANADGKRIGEAMGPAPDGMIRLADGTLVKSQSGPLSPEARAFLEQGRNTGPSTRKVVVDGGGPTGALAAIQAFHMGHEVTVVEMRDEATLPILWSNRPGSMDILKLVDPVLADRVAASSGKINFYEHVGPDGHKDASYGSSRQTNADRATGDPRAIAAESSSWQSQNKTEVTLMWDRLVELEAQEKVKAAAEGREPRLKLMRGYQVTDLPAGEGNRRGVVVQKIEQQLVKIGADGHSELGPDGKPMGVPYHEGDPVPPGYKLQRTTNGQDIHLGTPDDMFVAEGAGSKTRSLAGSQSLDVGPSAEYIAGYFHGPTVKSVDAEGRPVQGGARTMEEYGKNGDLIHMVAGSGEHLDGTWALPEVDPALNLKDPDSIEAYFGKPMSSKEAALAYYKQQISKVLGVRPDEIPDNAFELGPAQFTMQSHVSSPVADDAQNVHLIGDSRGNSHFLASLGKVTGTGTHQMAIRQYFQALSWGMHPDIAHAILERRLDAGTRVWLKSGLPSLTGFKYPEVKPESPLGIIRTADKPMQATPFDQIPIEDRQAARREYSHTISRLENGEHVVVPRGKASVEMMAKISAATGREVALLREKGGERFLLMGGAHEVELPPGVRIIAHTHPGGDLRFSTQDEVALHALGQHSSVLIGADGSAGRFRIAGDRPREQTPEQLSLHEPLVPGGWAFDRDWMDKAEVIDKGTADKNGHANETMIVTLKGADGRTVKGVFKPQSGEASLRQNVKAGTYYIRESVASRLDEAMNLGLVPTTVTRTIDGQVGSLQVFADGARGIGFGGTPNFERADYEKFKLFDYIQGNSDRHNGNIMARDIGGSPRPIAIDNGLGYPLGVNEWWRLADNLAKPSPTPGALMPETIAFAQSLELPKIAEVCASSGLEQEATRHVLRRAMRVKNDPGFLLGDVNQVNAEGKIVDQKLTADQIAEIDALVTKAYGGAPATP